MNTSNSERALDAPLFLGYGMINACKMDMYVVMGKVQERSTREPELATCYCALEVVCRSVVFLFAVTFNLDTTD